MPQKIPGRYQHPDYLPQDGLDPIELDSPTTPEQEQRWDKRLKLCCEIFQGRWSLEEELDRKLLFVGGPHKRPEITPYTPPEYSEFELGLSKEWAS